MYCRVLAPALWLVLLELAAVRGHSFLQQQRGVSLSRKEPSSYKQTLHNFQNVQYFADFKLGGQTIPGIFDTGSFELLVRSSRCAKCAHPTPPYDHLLSTSYLENGTVTKHVFGSGPCISVMGYETVSVGHLESVGQAFWEIMDHRISVLDTAKFAAIVGIGPNFAYGNSEQTLLMSYGVDEFSICLQKPSGSPGFLTWGPEEIQLDRKRDYATAKVTGEHHWSTKLENVTFQGVNGDPVNMPCSGGKPCSAIVDSGTSLIAAPGIALMQLSEMIPQIKEDCSNLHELPVLTFVIDGTPLELPPQAYVMRVTGASLEADDIWDLLFFKPKIRKVDQCMPAFMQIDMESKQGPVWILGMPFFRYYHTTFDRKMKELRFAHAGKNCEPEPFKANRTASLLAVERAEESMPMSMDVSAMVPPTLSEQMDYPFDNAGELNI
jgi:hypothetical protein